MDDEKFTDVIIDQFETVSPNESIYLVKTTNSDLSLNYTTSKDSNVIYFYSLNDPEFVKATSNLEAYSVVVFHNLISEYKKELLLNTTSKGTNFHWMSWGYDLYNISSLKSEFLSRDSKRYLYAQRNLNWYLGNLLKNLTPRLARFKSSLNNISEKKYLKALKKIHSYTTVVPDESRIIRNYLNNNAVQLPLKYGDLAHLIKTPQENICTDNNFFLGNSATPSSNHLEALKLIRNISDIDKKIYIPISYGDTKYGYHLKKIASSIVENEMIFLEDFIDLKGYNEILLKCGNVILNHYRQQAMGNVVIALYNGARVFLNEKNPIYSFLKTQGVKVFNIQKDLNMIDTLPSFEDLAKFNRPILESIYGREKVIEETRQFVEYFEKNKGNSKKKKMILHLIRFKTNLSPISK